MDMPVKKKATKKKVAKRKISELDLSTLPEEPSWEKEEMKYFSIEGRSYDLEDEVEEAKAQTLNEFLNKLNNELIKINPDFYLAWEDVEDIKISFDWMDVCAIERKDKTQSEQDEELQQYYEDLDEWVANNLRRK